MDGELIALISGVVSAIIIGVGMGVRHLRKADREASAQEAKKEKAEHACTPAQPAQPAQLPPQRAILPSGEIVDVVGDTGRFTAVDTGRFRAIQETAPGALENVIARLEAVSGNLAGYASKSDVTELSDKIDDLAMKVEQGTRSYGTLRRAVMEIRERLDAAGIGSDDGEGGPSGQNGSSPARRAVALAPRKSVADPGTQSEGERHDGNRGRL